MRKKGLGVGLAGVLRGCVRGCFKGCERVWIIGCVITLEGVPTYVDAS